MPMRGRRPLRTVRSGQRRKLVWARIQQVTPVSLAASSSTSFSLLSNFQTILGADLIGCTITRIRGSLSLGANLANQQIRVCGGIAVFPGALTSSLVGPATHQHEDWMYWSWFWGRVAATGEFAVRDDIVIDTRAQRKLEELEEDLVFAVENQSTDAVFMSFAFSTLVKLP